MILSFLAQHLVLFHAIALFKVTEISTVSAPVSYVQMCGFARAHQR